LIGHAHDARTPAGTSWLLAGAVATGLAARRGPDRRLAAPAPWLFVLLLVAILSAIWFFAVSCFLRVDAWSEP
jgi:hypothetical protein